jgi:hypothetical protein
MLIGRKSSRLMGFDFLSRGNTLLSFHLSGKHDFVIHEFNKKIRWCEMTGKSSVINLIGIKTALLCIFPIM